MEAIIVIVGFLGVGKTTLLKEIVQKYMQRNWQPFVILNDYENASFDADSFLSFLPSKQISALSGSCICCSGVSELRKQVNDIPMREKGITLIEANGTTDATSLMGFLGIGMKEHFLPPVQIAVVDVRSWQKRGHNNELEANQVQMASLIILNFTQEVPIERVVEVEQDIGSINSYAKMIHWKDLEIERLPELHPNKQEAKKMDHHKSHWASCSVKMPDPISKERLEKIAKMIPSQILRVKGCTRINDENEQYSYFERTPSGEIFIRPFYAKLADGPKLLTIGPGSDPEKLLQIIRETETV